MSTRSIHEEIVVKKGHFGVRVIHNDGGAIYSVQPALRELVFVDNQVMICDLVPKLEDEFEISEDLKRGTVTVFPVTAMIQTFGEE